MQDLDEEQGAPSEKEVRDDRPLNEFGLGGLELGGSVWSLDRDKDGPWTLIRQPKRKPALRPCKYPTDRELFHVAKEDDKGSERASVRRGKYDMAKVAADSGAADHVAPVQTASRLEVRDTEASRQGVNYVAANGHKIANLGANEDPGRN